MKLQASYDNGETWIGLDRYAAVVALAKVRAGGRFMAWLRAGYVIEANGVDYRIASGS